MSKPLPLISSFSSRKEWEDACWTQLMKSPKILHLITTVNERHNLVLRAAALDQLRAGARYTRIAKELWLSPQTISAIQKAAKERSYQSYRERGKSDRKKKSYSHSLTRHHSKARRGKAVRTKYGTVHLP